MKYRKIFYSPLGLLLLLVLVSPFNGQEEGIAQESQYLDQVVLCRDVEEKEPLLETTSFQVWDEKVVCWISFSYYSPESFFITWEWEDPAGNIYHVGNLEMEGGNYQNYRTWYWINIRDHYAANLTGGWKVRVYIDGVLLAVKDFTIG